MGIFPDRSDKKIPLTEALDQQPKPIPEPAPAPATEPEPEPVAEPEPEPATVAEVVDVDSELKQHARAIRSASRSIVSNVLKIGEHLAQAQELLASKRVGTFGRWCREDCNLSRSVAYRLVQVHRSFGNVPGAGTLLAGVPTRLLQDLAAVPEATTQVVEVIDSGESLTEPLGRQILTATRPATGEVNAEPGAVKKPDPITFMVDGGAVIVRLERPGVNVAQLVARLAKKLLAEDQAKRAAA